MPRKDLKRHLLEIRAGIHDEKILKPCKAHTDEQIIERYKCLVNAKMQVARVLVGAVT